MRQNLFQRCVVLSTLIVFAISLYWLGELTSLGGRVRGGLLVYWQVAALFLIVLMANLTALFYGAARRLYLMETGRRLRHVDQQVQGEGRVNRSLSRALAAQDREQP